MSFAENELYFCSEGDIITGEGDSGIRLEMDRADLNDSGAPADCDANVTVALTPQAPEEAVDASSTVAEESQKSTPAFSKQFQFICFFAGGGMGRIAKAKDTVFDRVVAVKSLHEKYRDDPQAIRAFLEECRLNARLDHPSIVPVYAIGRDDADGGWQVAMKLINGTSLTDFISSTRKSYDAGRVNARQEYHALNSRLESFLKICEVIGYCHSRGIVHGDIKPENILIGQFGELYVMDWGCAQPAGSVPQRLNGTPNYLPPEFLQNRRITTQIDVYSLGMLLFELTTLQRGRNPNLSEKNLDPARVNVAAPESYRNCLPGMKFPFALRAIIRKAVAPDPSQRYRSVSDLAADVRHFIYDEEVGAAPDSLLGKLFRTIYRHRIRTLLIAGTLFALLCGWGVYVRYEANRRELLREQETMRRLRLQSYTDMLATALEKNFLLSQAQLLLFADNLIEDMQENPQITSKFYDSEDFHHPESAPPGMQKSEYYPEPISLSHMVRIQPETPPEVRQNLLDPDHFASICNKIICYDLSSHRINEARGIHRILLSERNLLHRLFVDWQDGTRYSYPGTGDTPGNGAPRFSRFSADQPSDNRSIVWSNPYSGTDGRHQINCRYPMYDAKDRFLGTAGLELRLEKVLAPLILAHIADPIHELYFIDRRNNIIAADSGRLLLPDSDGRLSNGRSAARIAELAAELRRRNLQQFEADLDGRSCFVSGSEIGIVDGLLLQLIDSEAMKNHHHEDIRLPK